MNAKTGNLDGIRLLDCAAEPAFLAGKLLAELGAEVIKVESLRGDPSRQRGPFVENVEYPEASVLWLSLNTSKRGITLDLTKERGRELFLALCKRCDGLLESDFCGERITARPGLDARALHAANPGLVICRASPFGQGGPYESWRGSDMTIVAAGGNLYPTGNPDRAPVRCSLPAAYFHGSLETAVAMTFALLGRQADGIGQVVDVSFQEAMVMPNMTTPTQFPFTGFKGARVGGGFRGGKAVFRELWPCQNGYVSFALRGGPARIPGIVALVRFMEENGMAPEALRQRDWTKYNHNLITQPEVDEIEAALAAFFRTKTMDELFHAACERNLMLAPANTAREIVGSRQLAARDFFVDVPDAGRGVTLRYPGAFAKSSIGGIGVRGPAPRLGEHNKQVYGEIGLDAEELRREGLI